MLRFFYTSIILLVISSSLSAQSNNSSSGNSNYNGPIDIIGNELTYPIEGISFLPSYPPANLGDINGDGFDDFLQNQTLIYLGGYELTEKPFQVMGNRILALGDVNGDGFADAMGITFSNSIYTGTVYKGSNAGLIEIETPEFDDYFNLHIKGGRYTGHFLTVLTNLDFNNDGYSDIVSSYFDRGSHYTIITYGSDNIIENGFENTTTQLINNRSVIEEYLLGYFEQDEKKFFAFENCENVKKEGFNSQREVYIDFFEMSEGDSLAYNTSIKVPNSTLPGPCSSGSSNYLSRVYFSELNNDNNIDLVYHFFGNVNVLKGNGIVDDSLEFQHNLVNAPEAEAPLKNVVSIHSIGDLNEDGIPEFQYLTEGQSDLLIGNFVFTDSSFQWNTLLEFSASELLEGSYFTDGSNVFDIYNIQYRTFQTSINPNERLISFSLLSEEWVERYLLSFSTTSASFFQEFELSKITFDVKEYSKIIRKELFYLGDLENDGIDNFATLESRNNKDYIVYRNGFYSNEIPEFKIPDSLSLNTIVAGNFISTTERSTVHLYNSKINEITSYLFFFDSDSIAKLPSLILELSGDLDFLNNIGDLNNDGFDEFGLSSRSSGFLIYKGGASFSDTSNFEIDPSQYLNTVGADNTTSSFGITQIQPVGDINNDALDDFVISDPTRKKNYPLANFHSTAGSIYLFYGKQDESFDFSIPDFEFLPDSTKGGPSPRFGGFNEIAYGDFDGDGLTDFAAKPARHENPERSEGAGAIQIFYAKNGYTSLPDTTIKIRSEYVTPTNQLSDNEYALELYRSLMKAVDIDNDGNDELLLVSGGGFHNAVLYDFDEGVTERATKLFTGLYPYPLNPSRKSTNKQYNSLVGDFVGDGGLYFIGYHTRTEDSFRDTPIMLFDLVNSIPVSNELKVEAPTTFSLSQNYPNPFNPTTSISFAIPRTTNVNLTIYNLLGQKVSTLINERLNSGSHVIQFNASSLSSGLYFYTLKTDAFLETRKMLLIK